MKRAKLLRTEPTECPETEEVEAASQIVEIDGKPILNIDFWKGRELKARYFADREKRDYAAWINGQWKACGLYNIGRLAQGKAIDTYYMYGMEDSAHFHAEEDKKRCRTYLGENVEMWESDIRYERQREKERRRQKRIDELMDSVPTAPDGLEPWMMREIFPEEYLFCQKEPEGFSCSCTACGKSWTQKEKLTDGKKRSCPKCGAGIIVKRRTKSVEKRTGITVLQIMDAETWVERGFRAVCTWEAGKKNLQLLEDIRALIPKNGHLGKVYYGTRCDKDELEQEWSDKNPINRRWPDGLLYPENVKEILSGTPLKHSGMEILAERKVKFRANSMIRYFPYHPYVEYLIKTGLTKLAVEVIETYGYWSSPERFREQAKKITELLNLDGNRLNRLKQVNGGVKALEWLWYEAEEGMKISQEALAWLNQKNISRDWCGNLPETVGSVNRMVNFLKKQKNAPRQALILWKDYLAMAAEEGMDTRDDIVRFPKELKLRHDQLVEIRNARMMEEKIAKNAKHYEELNEKIRKWDTERYRYREDGYLIRPAACCQELAKESQALHHCVGASTNYMEKMANGESWILFLRREEEPEKPYYTIEINKNDVILQWRSEYNRQPDADTIRKILDHFTKQLKKAA